MKNFDIAPTPTSQNTNTLDALALWHRIITRSLKELPVDLSARQLGLLLSVYMTPPPHTIRSLAETLQISKPAVCRAVDMLSMNDLVKRKKDETDRRNVFIQRTINGSVFLSDFADIIMQETGQSESELDIKAETEAREVA